MKTILSIAISMLFIFSASQTPGQCALNIGNDTTVCVMGLSELTLGESLTIDGGTPPYTYAWSSNYSIGPLQFTASDFLNDTTLANPELLYWSDDSLVFQLAVTDFMGNTCSDTLVVYFCHFAMTLEDKQITIMQGDTAQLYPGVFGNCQPITYQWSPDYNISDPNIPNPVVWPDSTTYYVATALDSAGCEIIDETFEVFVSPVSTSDNLSNPSVAIYPNPMSDFATIEINGINAEKLRIDFYDIQGRLVSQNTLSGKRHQISSANFRSGLYIYRLFQNDQPFGQGKLVVE